MNNSITCLVKSKTVKQVSRTVILPPPPTGKCSLFKYAKKCGSNRHRAYVWCLLSKNNLRCFVIVAKRKQNFNSPTFSFLTKTKLNAHGVYRLALSYLRVYSTLWPNLASLSQLIQVSWHPVVSLINVDITVTYKSTNHCEICMEIVLYTQRGNVVQGRLCQIYGCS